MVWAGLTDPYPDDGPLPYLDARAFCGRHGWTYREYCATPALVRAYWSLYDEIEDRVREFRRQSASS